MKATIQYVSAGRGKAQWQVKIKDRNLTVFLNCTDQSHATRVAWAVENKPLEERDTQKRLVEARDESFKRGAPGHPDNDMGM